MKKDYIYARNWQQSKAFVVAVFPHFDILVNKDAFYLIRMPNYYAAAWGTFIGLVIFRLIGAVIGAAIGAGMDMRKRKTFSLKWIDANDNLTSTEYEKRVFLKIPRADLKKELTIVGNKLQMNYDGKKLVLKNKKQEAIKFITALQANLAQNA